MVCRGHRRELGALDEVLSRPGHWPSCSCRPSCCPCVLSSATSLGLDRRAVCYSRAMAMATLGSWPPLLGAVCKDRLAGGGAGRAGGVREW